MPERVLVERAGHHFAADHECRRCLDRQRRAQLLVTGQRGLVFGLGHVFLPPFQVQSCVAGHPFQRGHGHIASAHERAVKLQVAALVMRGQRGQRGGGGFRAENRKLLEDHADVGVLVNQLLHHRIDLLAVPAAVVEELDNRDNAIALLRLAGHRRSGICHQFGPLRRHCGLRLFALRGGLTHLQGLAHLDENFGVLQQIGADRRLKLSLGQELFFGAQGGSAEKNGGHDQPDG